jgi:hypothetical protein
MHCLQHSTIAKVQQPFVQLHMYESTVVPRPLPFLIMLRWPCSRLYEGSLYWIPFLDQNRPTARLREGRYLWYCTTNTVHRDTYSPNGHDLLSRLGQGVSLKAISLRPGNTGADGPAPGNVQFQYHYSTHRTLCKINSPLPSRQNALLQFCCTSYAMAVGPSNRIGQGHKYHVQ